jgi:uncharacterized membrane protein
MEIVMSKTDRIINSAFASLLAVGLAAGASQAFAAKDDTEKCAGIVKAGKNDCGTSKNACAGQVKADNDAEAWISVPKGLCERIVGGHIQTSPNAKHGGKG